jgi:hypothetical protein
MSQISKPFPGGGDSAVFSVIGTNGVTASPTTGNVIVSGVNATISTVGVASFNPADFTVSISGEVTAINTGTISSVQTANATPQFALVGTVETVDFNISNLILGSSLPVRTSGSANVGMGATIMNTLTSGSDNTGMGNSTLQSITSGTGNVAIGVSAGRFLTSASSNTYVGASAGSSTTIGENNSAFGYGALSSYTTGATNIGQNIAIGSISLTGLTSGTFNTAIGANSASTLLTGTNNIFVGYNTGDAYTASESSNILIGNTGVVGESNIIRIGIQGSGAGQQNQCFLAGVLNTVSGRVVKTTIPGAYPYTTLLTDDVIFVDTSIARTINLIASPTTGTTYRIKDNVGTAGTNNITITPNAGTIDGAASATINTNWGSVDIVYNATSWRIL